MLRKRKNRRYNETNDEEGDGERKFDLAEQIKSERFNHIREKHLQEISGEAITLRLMQRNGFEKPILVIKPDGLDLRVPPKTFLVRDVRNCVGANRTIDVMDVKTQKNIEMSMKDWCKYYESKSRDRLLNVISLEFSHTKLDELVESPMIVKLLDWVDLVWPKFLKKSQTESTNSIDKMKYPKVQKYCLMSVKGSYTDFHIDFGGTSVWYHILRGKKIFWMVPPTELNLQIFEEWTLSGMQQDVFFGDTVEECFRVELCAGNTFFIPSGWIHAVYTIEDSLVFGGNFLHSFGIENQLKVSKIEDATKVPIKFRYPFYTEILWYAVQHYVYCLTNKDHLHRPNVAAAAAAAATTSASLAPAQAEEVVALTAPKATSSAIKEKSELQKKHDNNSSTIAASNNSTEIEDDESTESEQEDSDTAKVASKTKCKNISTPSSANKRRCRARPSRSAQKKSKKPPPTDDESTDIDSGTEEIVKQSVEKPTVNTCRMTKNSLLRLQYEIDESELLSPSKKSNKSGKLSESMATTSQTSNSKTSSSPKSSTSKKKTSNAQQTEILTTSTTTNNSSTVKLEHKPAIKNEEFKDATLSTVSSKTKAALTPTSASLNLSEIKQEIKSNGWSTTGSGWSTSTSNELRESSKIHITKFEVNGLKVLVKHLSKLSGAKKNLPTLIRNSRALLDDCKKLIAEHENDDPELAVTGKPITPELLKPKTTNMNDLIDQFFKPIDDSTHKISSTGGSSSSSSFSNTTGTSSSKQVQSESSSPHNRSKLASQSESLTCNSQLKADEKKTTTTANNNTMSANEISNNNINSNSVASKSLSSSSSISSATQKETKCLSPNKKLSSNATSSSSFTSPPLRPKSPPTRPLSNNQYTSKTKNNNNLLLPGSFADLIAATSTEKKVFDVSSADVASSFFGMKDLAPNKYKSITSKSPINKSSKSSSACSSGSSTTTHINNNSSIKPTSCNDTLNSPHITSPNVADIIKTSATSSIGATQHNKQVTNSPEPLKVATAVAAPQVKRFITPATFRQPNKEKLIYASAPYISPVHASEQSRSSSNVYPWQTPTHHYPPHHQQQQQPTTQPQDSTSTTYTPILPHTPQRQVSLTSSNPTAVTTPMSIGQSLYSSDSQALSKQSQVNNTILPLTAKSSATLILSVHNNSKQEKNHDQKVGAGDCTKDQSSVRTEIAADNNNVQHAHPIPETRSANENHLRVNLDIKPDLVQQKHQAQTQQQQLKQLNQHTASTKNDIQSSATTALAKLSPIEEASLEAKEQNLPKNTIANISATTTLNQQPKVSTITPSNSASKPTKPRDPPKKSKEARQVIVDSTAVAAPVPTSVIRVGLPAVQKESESSKKSESVKTITFKAAVPSAAAAGISVPLASSGTPITPFPVPVAHPSTVNKATKAKPKRSKKQKEVNVFKNVAQLPPNSQAAPTTSVIAMTPNQVRPSVICGLVKPQQTLQAPLASHPAATSTSVETSKLNPQSYLIFRPLFSFPSIPNFSAAQLQQLQQQQQQQLHHHHQQQQQQHYFHQQHQQRPMNLLTTPMSSHLGLPLQPGARIVWATPPQRYPGQTMPVSNSGGSHQMLSHLTSTPSPSLTGKMHNFPPFPNTSTHSDNAALLSLATTALSTASMTSSPAFSHLNHKLKPSTLNKPQ